MLNFFFLIDFAHHQPSFIHSLYIAQDSDEMYIVKYDY